MKRFLVLALMVALLLTAVGCGGGDKSIKIGFLAPITGPAAADGESAKRAAELAVKEINAAGGIDGRELKLLVNDDRLDSKEAVNIANKLIGEKVVAVISGSYSGTTRAVAPVLQQAKIPMITAYAVHPDITKAGKYMFRQSFLGTVQGRAGAEVAVKLLGAKKISILAIDNDFGKTLGSAFKERAEALGATIVSNDIFPAGEKEFNPILTKIKGLEPDLIYMVAYASEGAQIVMQAKSLGIKAQILGTEGIDSTKQFLGVAKEAAEGVIITTNLNRDDERPVAKNFFANFKKAYGVDPDMVAASTYDAVYVLANALKQAKSTDPDKIRDAIAATKNFEAVTGTIQGYTAGGEVLKTVQVQKVQGGSFHYFNKIADPTVLTPPQ
ncbi:MAG: ABC transporter substrate-binding protein [Firmicutes bacterium]|nr:ABC transporter substrate-binding protein [Bacillota bacterium]